MSRRASHVELRLPARVDTRLQLLVRKSRRDPLLQELVHLLGCAADEALRLEELAELALDGVEVWVGPDAVNQVVLEALRLHLVRRLVRENLPSPARSASFSDSNNRPKRTYPDLLVRLLAVAAGLDDGHDDVLRGHERQLLRDPACDDLRVDDEALGDVLQRREHDVCGEERLGERDPPVRAARVRPSA